MNKKARAVFEMALSRPSYRQTALLFGAACAGLSRSHSGYPNGRIYE